LLSDGGDEMVNRLGIEEIEIDRPWVDHLEEVGEMF